MYFLCSIFRVLAHSQIFMALSAVCYVSIAEVYLQRSLALNSWLLAAFFGTLGLYLLDSVRSAEREDAISQPERASYFRKHRAPAVISSFASLVLALVCIGLARPGWGAWCILFLLALLGGSYLSPVIPLRGGWATLKSFSYVKPVTISLAWLLGALLVGWDSVGSSTPGGSISHSLLFALSTLPLLLLDSIWLDRRDRLADVAFGHPTISSAISAEWFQLVRVVLWCLPFLALVFMPELWMLALSLQVGSLCLVLIEPDRLASEVTRVILASTWRFTGLVGAIIWVG